MFLETAPSSSSSSFPRSSSSSSSSGGASDRASPSFYGAVPASRIPRKRKAESLDSDDGPKKQKTGAAARPRNRASPLAIVKANEHLTGAQKTDIRGMDFGPLLDIKCTVLNNAGIDWLAKQYDKKTREIVVPGRGRIAADEHAVHRIMHIPRGNDVVRYAVDPDVEKLLIVSMFGEDGSTPKTTRVAEILKGIKVGGVRFKRIWLMHAVCTMLSPTTRNKVSNRCYTFLQNIGNVQNLNWCKFVADQLHAELSSGKHSKGCLFFYMLLYVDSLDVSGLDLDLPDGEFPINIWTKEAIDAVFKADLQDDNVSFGKLQLKPGLGINDISKCNCRVF